MPTTTGCLTNYAEQKILDHLVRKTTWTLPTCYFGLWNGSPTETGAGGAEVTTPGTNGYARIAVGTGGSCKFNAAGSRATTSNVDVVFGPSTGGPWSNAQYWVMMDAASGGNMIAYGQVTDTAIGTDDSYKIASGDIDLTWGTTSQTQWVDSVVHSLLDHITGRTSYTAPDTWLALYEGDPLGAGAETTTAGTQGYARQDLDAAMAAASGGSIANGSEITFGPASGANWGTVDYMAVMSALTAGSVMGGAALTASKTINDGQSAKFAVGALTFTLN